MNRESGPIRIGDQNKLRNPYRLGSVLPLIGCILDRQHSFFIRLINAFRKFLYAPGYSERDTTTLALFSALQLV